MKKYLMLSILLLTGCGDSEPTHNKKVEQPVAKDPEVVTVGDACLADRDFVKNYFDCEKEENESLWWYDDQKLHVLCASAKVEHLVRAGVCLF